MKRSEKPLGSLGYVGLRKSCTSGLRVAAISEHVATICARAIPTEDHLRPAPGCLTRGRGGRTRLAPDGAARTRLAWQPRPRHTLPGILEHWSRVETLACAPLLGLCACPAASRRDPQLLCGSHSCFQYTLMRRRLPMLRHAMRLFF